MIPLIYTWARSGATIFNKCLSAMGHLVLSEVHPKINSGVHAPRWQAVRWHGIDIPTGISWKECIFKLADIVAQQSRSLIIRDWTVNSFYPHEYNKNSPVRQLQAHKLLGERYIPVAFVRDAIDCALSFAVFHHWSSSRQLDAFTRAYLRYANQIKAAAIPIFHYEDFCQNPEGFLAEFCTSTGVCFSKEWTKFYRVTKLLGDTYHVTRKGSRATSSTRIEKLPRRRVLSLLQQHIVMHQGLHKANRLLGCKHNGGIHA